MVVPRGREWQQTNNGTITAKRTLEGAPKFSLEALRADDPCRA